MTHYQRISPVYEAVKYEPGMEDGFSSTGYPFLKIFPDKDSTEFLNRVAWSPGLNAIILTNTATGERSVVSPEEFDREFREVEG